MDKIDSLLNKLKTYDTTNINNKINIIVESNKDQIIKWNTKYQLFDSGINALGERLRHKYKDYPQYSDGYTKRKKKLGKLQQWIDLSLFGGYLKSWTITYEDTSFFIGSKDVILKKGFNLSEHLRDIYGDEIEGLTEKYIRKLKDIITSELIINIKKEINL